MEMMESFVREVVMAVRCGSWAFAKELETERLLFPEAYAMRMKLEAER